jgi:hypothetical protein
MPDSNVRVRCPVALDKYMRTGRSWLQERSQSTPSVEHRLLALPFFYRVDLDGLGVDLSHRQTSGRLTAILRIPAIAAPSSDDKVHFRDVRDYAGRIFSSKRSANRFSPQLRAKSDAELHVGS